jgi:serine/threonine protein kinase
MSKKRDDSFYELQRIISEKSKPIVFWTGAGVSAPILPSWKSLLDAVIKVAEMKVSTISDNKHLIASIKSAETETDLWRSFERLSSIEQGIGPESFRSVVSEALGPSNSADIPEVQKLLWQFSPKGVVTLNLDLFTQRSATELKSRVPIVIAPSQFGKNLSVFKEIRPFIAYPHGLLDDFHSWTFTSSVLAKRLADKEYLTWVTTLLASHTVVFLGVTADDLAVGGLMEKLMRKTGGEFRGNYWITGRNDSATDHWAEERGIRVIRYEVDGNDHSDLLALLKEIQQHRPTESPLLELPILATLSHAPCSDSDVLPPADEIDLRDKESLRRVLNAHANDIFSRNNDNIAGRDEEFRRFLTEYEDAVHNSYHTSIAPGKNSFLGYMLQGRADGGAFGNVFHALDKFGNSVAIKILHAEKLNDQEFYRNFRRGVNSLKILSERRVDGIVGFKDAVEIPPSLVMEWVDGTTLSQAAHLPELSDWGSRFKLLLRLTEILSHSHSLPERVLHRDLRPANIMIRNFFTAPEELDVVVLDFDLSWHKGAEDHSVMYSPAMGYLAPEQRRRIAKVGTKSTLVDSYGFGMVAYYLIARIDPIPDQHLIANWDKNLEDLARSNPFVALSCGPRRMVRMIKKCTLENQHQRMQISQAQGELQSIVEYLDNPELLSSTSLITEELAATTDHMSGYIWDDERSSADTQVSAERATSLRADISSQTIVLKIDWMNTGVQDWGQINRLVERGLPKMLDSLTTAGWQTSHTKQARSFTVQAMIDANEVAGNVRVHAAALDKALAQVFAMGGY